MLKLDEKKRVAILSRHLKSNPYTGISVYSVNLANLLVDLGYSVTIFAEGNSNEPRNENYIFEVIQIPKTGHLIKSMLLMKTPHPVAAWLIGVADQLEGFTTVIAPVVGLQSMIFRTKVCKNRIITLHTPYSRTSPLGMFFRYFQSYSFNYADKIIANSGTIVTKFKFIQSKKVFYVPHETSQIVLHPDFSEEKRWIWVGTLTLRKGVDRLLRILVLNRDSNIDVVYSRGKFGLLPELILKGLERLKYCTLFTRVSGDDLNALYYSASALICTSRYESFGLTLVEAAARQRGTIGVDSPGVKETLPINEGAVWLNNCRQIVMKLKSNAGDISFWKLLGLDAKKYVDKKYSRSIISNNLRNLIE